jgi:hypothetical protein
MLTSRHNRQNVWKHSKNFGFLFSMSYSCVQISHFVADDFMDAMTQLTYSKSEGKKDVLNVLLFELC